MMLNTNNPTPLYKQLYHQLRKQLKNGDYQAGEKLPSVRDLAADCGISRLTVRRAIGLLERDGCVHVQHGSGVFVLPFHNPDPPVSRKELAALLATDEDVAESRTICVNTVVADEALAKSLCIHPGAKVIRLERIRFAGDTPVSLDVSWLPTDLCMDDVVDALDMHARATD